MINFELKYKKTELIKIKRTNLHPKVILALIMSLFLVSIITVATPVKTTDPNRNLIIAKGDDADISGATTFIIGEIKFSDESTGRVFFHIKIRDETGKKVYMMKGMLKDGAVMVVPYFYCTVRNVTWTNLWLVMGEGKIKTTDTDMEIEYRGETIMLPNTGGQYVPATIFMFVSPNGEYLGGVWEQGGWATAGIMVGGTPSVGVVTYLKSYMEI